MIFLLCKKLIKFGHFDILTNLTLKSNELRYFFEKKKYISK